MKVLVAALVLGFPVTLVWAWAFEITPEGVKRTEDVEPGKSIARRTGRKIVSMTVVLTATAAGLFVFRQLRPRPGTDVNELDRTSGPRESLRKKEGRGSTARMLWQGLEALPILDLRNQYRERCRKEELRFRRRTGRLFCAHAKPNQHSRLWRSPLSAKPIGHRYMLFFAAAAIHRPMLRTSCKVFSLMCSQKKL